MARGNPDPRVSRRVFLAVAIATGAVNTVGAQDESEEGEETGEEGEDGAGTEEETGGEGQEGGENGEEAGEGGGEGGGTEQVIVGPGGDFVFEPEQLTIQPGTTVLWTWESDSHNVNPTEVPEDAEWEGYVEIENTGFEYEFTFDVEGEYHYVCDPHVAQGMEGDVIVGGDAEDEAAAGQADVDIHDLGVPIQKHFVGVATFLAIFVSLVFTFYLLKYGESSHSQSPGRKR